MDKTDKFRIKVMEGEHAGQYFVRYDSERNSPVFSEDVREAGEFVHDGTRITEDSVCGNLIALEDRFGYKGLPEVCAD